MKIRTRKPLFCFLSALLSALLLLNACGNDAQEMPSTNVAYAPWHISADEEPEEIARFPADGMPIEMVVGKQIFDIQLENNPSSRAFYRRLPIRVTMLDLHGTEKYYYFPDLLPANDVSHPHIYEGDLMLYTASSLEIFYVEHDNKYSYTQLGKVLNTDGLAKALGEGTVRVTFRTKGEPY